MKSFVYFSIFIVGVVVVVIELSSIAMGAASRSNSLCKKNEKVYFSCRLKKNKRKIISICGSKKLAKTKGYLKYRFGTKKKIALEYPKGYKNTQKAFEYGSYTRPVQGDQLLLTGAYYLIFKRKGYNYTVFQEYADSKKGEHEESHGVRISFINKNGEEDEIDLKCRMPVTGRLFIFREIVTGDLR